MKREKWKERALAAEASVELWRTAYRAAYDEWKKLSLRRGDKQIMTRKQQPEFEIQKLVCEYLCRQYPKVLFLSDARAFLKLTIPQAIRSKSVQKPGFACPDLMIFASRCGFHGLFLELKAKTIYQKNGELLKNSHVEAQRQSIIDLRHCGYQAHFACSFNEARELIDDYLSLTE